jgi:paraquat-inducible protein B
MLLGGVAFGTPQHMEVGKRADADTRFRLYPDEKAALNPRYERRQPWRMAFQGSVRGLLPGAPVEFRGIRIGEVSEIRLQLDADEREAHIPVTVWIEPERLGAGATSSDTDEVSASERALWDRLMNGGLRAQLKTGSLITGALYIDLDFYPDAPPREIVWGEGIPEFPTVPAPLDELRGLLSRLSRLPLDQMGEDLSKSLVALRETMETTNVLMGRLDRETVSELNRALVQTRKTLVSAEKVLSPNSALQLEARRVLQELGSAARSFRIMADYLERHPEALIRGKGAGTQ